MINEEPYTVQEAGDVLGVTRSAVYKMLKKGLLEGFYVGENEGGVRIDKSEVARYKKDHSTKKSFAPLKLY